MVAGNDVPGDMRDGPHALQRLQQGLLGGRVIVIEVARHQHMGRPFGARQPADRLDGGKPRLPQHAFLFAEVAERLADLPVRGVNESHGAKNGSPRPPRQPPWRLHGFWWRKPAGFPIYLPVITED